MDNEGSNQIKAEYNRRKFLFKALTGAAGVGAVTIAGLPAATSVANNATHFVRGVLNDEGLSNTLRIHFEDEDVLEPLLSDQPLEGLDDLALSIASFVSEDVDLLIDPEPDGVDLLIAPAYDGTLPITPDTVMVEIEADENVFLTQADIEALRETQLTSDLATQNPELFEKLSAVLTDAGHEVVATTGPSKFGDTPPKITTEVSSTTLEKPDAIEVEIGTGISITPETQTRENGAGPTR